ncbi:MAG: ATP synthase F0 subunit B [Parcubacteria group bacterium]|nr:ATP synthase F0 subunit B [Parcubacteria group bacterium]
MSEFIDKVGIDLRLLAAQLVNFLIVLFVLHRFIYRPLLKLLKERQAKIQKGLEDAKKSRELLLSMEQEKRKRVQLAEKEAQTLLKKTEEEALQRDARLLKKTEQQAEEMLKSAEKLAVQKQLEAEQRLARQSTELVRQMVCKIAQKEPEKFDQSLVEETFKELKKQTV